MPTLDDLLDSLDVEELLPILAQGDFKPDYLKSLEPYHLNKAMLDFGLSDRKRAEFISANPHLSEGQNKYLLEAALQALEEEEEFISGVGLAVATGFQKKDWSIPAEEKERVLALILDKGTNGYSHYSFSALIELFLKMRDLHEKDLLDLLKCTDLNGDTGSLIWRRGNLTKKTAGAYMDRFVDDLTFANVFVHSFWVRDKSLRKKVLAGHPGEYAVKQLLRQSEAEEWEELLKSNLEWVETFPKKFLDCVATGIISPLSQISKEGLSRLLRAQEREVRMLAITEMGKREVAQKKTTLERRSLGER